MYVCSIHHLKPEAPQFIFKTLQDFVFTVGDTVVYTVGDTDVVKHPNS